MLRSWSNLRKSENFVHVPRSFSDAEIGIGIYRRGVSVNELLEKAKEEEAKRRAEEAEKLKSTLKPQQSVDTSTQSSSSSSLNSSTSKTAPKWERKDAAPYKVCPTRF